MKALRSFNTAGPCNPQEHYMIDPMRGLGKEILTLIKEKSYFVIHAARQSGKTTLLRALARHIRAEGDYYALYCSLAGLDGVADSTFGISSVIATVKSALADRAMPNAPSFANGVDLSSPLTALQDALKDYCRSLGKPLVILFDEADSLVGATMIAFLQQIRNGYLERDEIPFVHSLALVGMRNIRDYKNDYRDPSQTLGTASPFNIASDSMTLKNFTKAEIAELYAQHTSDTGQLFLDDAVDFVWEQTQGQPWLVNAIARVIVRQITASAPQAPVTVEMVSEAIQILIMRWDTHFDSLLARLNEQRVRRAIEPIISGYGIVLSRNSSDYSYVRDMGLIRDDRGRVEPANPIYGDIIVRVLSRDTQEEIGLNGNSYPIPKYLKDGEIDIDTLLGDFQIFWRENEAIWQKKYDYQEAAPQIIVQAFLQRVVNGGGRITREMAAATGRIDLCVEYRGRRYPIELKIRRGDDTYAEGLLQTAAYMDKLGIQKGWLVLFDQRKRLPWEDKLFVKKELISSESGSGNEGGKTVTVYGC